MYLILGDRTSDVVIFRFNPSADNLYVPLNSPEIVSYFIVLLWVADKEMTTVYPPSEIDKRQTSPNANVTKVTTVSVDIFMFFDTDFMFGIGRSSPRSIFCGLFCKCRRIFLTLKQKVEYVREDQISFGL